MKINVPCKGNHQGCHGRYWGTYYQFPREDGFVLPSHCPSCTEVIEEKNSIFQRERQLEEMRKSEEAKERLRQNYDPGDYP